jgi:arylsulfatase A-like enzyme
MMRPCRRICGFIALLLVAGVVGATGCRQAVDAAPAPLSGPLLEALDGARVQRLDAPRPEPTSRIETDVDGGVTMSLPLSDRGAWKRLSAKRPAGLDLKTTNLVGWYLATDLPTTQPDGVRLTSPKLVLGHWDRPTPPNAPAGFYQRGGFVAKGVYVALPRDRDPRELNIVAHLHPTMAAMVDHLAGAESPFPADVLATDAIKGVVSRPSLFLTSGVAVGWSGEVADGSWLRFGLARAPRSGAAGSPPSSLRVRFLDPTQGQTLLDRAIALPGSDATEWAEVEIDLGAVAGRSGELVLQLESADGAHGSIYVGDPSIEGNEVAQAPNLVFIVIDGLRGDRLDDPDLTPNLRKLAASGLRFDAAQAPASWTRPSIASLFSGTPPALHRVERERNSHRLAPDLPTLAQVLRRVGYATAAISANFHLHPAFGLHRGFGYHQIALVDGRDINRAALGWIDARPPRPFFLFVFYMDTHFPFRHRPEYDRSSALEVQLPSWGLATSLRVRRRDGIPDPSDQQLARLEALYDENVRYADERVGELLAGLAQRGLGNDTLVVVTADHGEAFAEHGDMFHGWNLHDELVHVPLILAGPGVATGTQEKTVSLLDLPASLLSQLDVPRGAIGGRSDLFAQTGSTSAAPVFSETRFRGSDAASVVVGNHKLILERGRGEAALFELSDDPLEKQDVGHLQPEKKAELEALLARWLAEARAARRGSEDSGPAANVTPETLEKLRALGYVPGDEPPHRPSPR